MEDSRADGLFGVNTEAIKQKLVEAIVTAHHRHVEAHLISGLEDQSHYGLIWKALPQACLVALRGVSIGTDVVRPANARYTLPVLDGVVVFPWRPRHGGDPAKTQFITSPSRGSVFTLQTNAQGMLDLPEYEPMGDQQDHDETGLHQMVDFASHEHLRVVVVAVESDAKRLWRISWGEVEPNEDGTLRFIEPELIFAGDETLVGRRVSALNATTTESPLRLVGASTPSFDAGLPPQRIIKKRSTGTGDK